MRLLLSVLLLAASAARADDAGPAFGSPVHFTETSGAAIYASVCAGCHMPGGVGAAGAGAYPALANNPRLASPGYPAILVLHGHSAMPPLGRLLSDDQVAAVVGYIRMNFGNSYPDPLSAAEIAKLR